jgi:hypothetical protein
MDASDPTRVTIRSPYYSADMSIRRLVAGMVGGGPGAMIGGAHRHAMWLDNQYVLAAGIFGRDAAKSAEFAEDL